MVELDYFCRWASSVLKACRAKDSLKRDIRRPRKLGLEHLEARQLLCASLTNSPCVESAFNGCDEFLIDGVRVMQAEEVAEVAEAASIDYESYSSSLTEAIDGMLTEAGENPSAVSRDFIFNLSSKPNSKHTIYLDFTGHTTSGTYWNSAYTNGASITTPVYSRDSSSAFSNTELRDIYEIWLRVSEDYMPFDVNVTTKEPAKSSLIKSSSSDAYYGVRVCIGGDCSDWYGSAASGVAAYDSFTWSSDTPVFVFAKTLYNLPRYIAESASHEVGHTFGLEHDGKNSTVYYQGANGWAPIMGSPYYQGLTQWSKGSYSGANNTQDDIAILGKALGYRSDDYAGTTTSATKLVFSISEKLCTGVISKSSDVDFFWFNLPDNHLVSSITVGGIAEVTNLDVIVKLYDSSKNLIKTYNPTGTLYATLDVSNLAAGKYYMSVAGTGKKIKGTTVYTNYGSLGAYTISCKKQSLTETEYASIRSAYSQFGLPASLSSLNIIGIFASELSAANLNKAIAQAGKTKGNDLIVVRTTSSKHTISYSSSSDAVNINIAKGSYGSLTIVALGPVPLKIDANAKSRAIKISSSTVNLGNLTITNGRAAEGGGISVSGSSVVQLVNCSIIGNTATNYGAGLYALNGSVSLINCAITGNSAKNLAGGMCLKYANTKFTNCTVAGNSAVYGAGAYVCENTTVNAYNSIFAENDGPNVHKKTGATINAYNVLSTFTKWTNGSDNVVYNSAYPLFKDAENGDYAILSASQALNKGKTSYATSAGLTSSSVDLAEKARIVSSEIDLGAFENQYALTEPKVTVTSVTSDAVQFSIGTVANAKAYSVEYSTNVDFINAKLVRYTSSGSKKITGLSPDTTYYMRVAAVASKDKSVFATAEVHTKTLGKIATPSASVAAKKSSSVQISIGAVANATAYVVEYGTHVNFSGAVSQVYDSAGSWWITGLEAGSTYYFRVKAMAAGYTDSDYGATFSVYEEPQTPLSSVVLSTNAPKVGSTVTTTISPKGGKATYQWYRGETLISGAKSSSYVPTSADVGYKLTVKAVGTGSYCGAVSATTSSNVVVPLPQLDAPSASVLAKTNTSVQISIGEVQGATNYTVEYARSADFSKMSSVTYGSSGSKLITGLTSGATYYLRVKASGPNYEDSDYCATFTSDDDPITPIEAIALSTDAPKVGLPISVNLLPTNSTADCQWYRGETAIPGATESTYVPTLDDFGYNLTVTVVGVGGSSGTLSATTALTVVVPPAQLSTPNASVLARTNSAVQVFISMVVYATSYTVDYALTDDFSDAQSKTFASAGSKWITGLSYGMTYYLRVKATASGFEDSGYSAAFCNFDTPSTPLTGVTLSTDAPKVGEAITATPTPEGAVATYQWYRGTASIPGATSATYVPTDDDLGRTLTVMAMGTDGYAGSATAAAASSVAVLKLDAPVLSILAKTNTAVQISIAAVANASTHTVDYSQNSDFSGASSKTYGLSGSKWITGLSSGATYYFRVKASASGYEDSNYSAPVSNDGSLVGTTALLDDGDSLFDDGLDDYFLNALAESFV